MEAGGQPASQAAELALNSKGCSISRPLGGAPSGGAACVRARDFRRGETTFALVATDTSGFAPSGSSLPGSSTSINTSTIAHFSSLRLQHELADVREDDFL